MKGYLIPLLLILLASLSCTKAIENKNNASNTAPLASLPDNPCEVLNAAEVSSITGVEVTSSNRVPSLDKIVRAQKENREPGPGTICSYETRSDFGAILISVPARENRNAADYWQNRSRYFETFPGAAQPVPNLGKDAWIAGGARLHVLVRGDEYFIVSTQMQQPRSRELLINIAQVVSGRL